MVNYTSKSSISLIDYIGEGIDHADNILQYVDSIFTQHSEFAPDLLIISEGQFPVVVLEEDLGEKTPVGSQDFLPILGLNSHRLLEVDGSVQLDASEGDDIWEFDLKLSYRLRSDGSLLRKEILSHFPSLDVDIESGKNPLFCAVKRRGEFLDILGVYLRANFGHMDEESDVEAINSSVHLMSGLLHESARRKSRFKVTVHQSIIDQVQNEDPSIPLAFLSRKDGALEHPMCVSFSDKVCTEFGLIPGIEFSMFRDSEFLFVTVNQQNTDSFLSRIRLADMANSNHRITKKQMAIAMKKAMNLKRNRSGVSFSSLMSKISNDKETGSEEIFSRVGISLKLAFSNVFLTVPEKKSGKWKTQHHTQISTMFDEIVPLLIHLCLARLDPELRGQIKRQAAQKGVRRRTTGRSHQQKSRRLVWGNDLVRYLSDSDGSNRARHFVNSHVRRIELKSEETIALYRKRKFPVTVENDIQIGYRMIRGHYRGTGDAPEWDGNYRFGKRPSYYSAKAIRWLNWIEENENVSIRHAEKGGELRIALASGHIQVDGYCKETNTVYEFHGDVYHGNPEIFQDGDQCHPFDKDITASELYQKTIDREAVIRSIGFNLVSIWERDWDKIESSN